MTRADECLPASASSSGTRHHTWSKPSYKQLREKSLRHTMLSFLILLLVPSVLSASVSPVVQHRSDSAPISFPISLHRGTRPSIPEEVGHAHVRGLTEETKKNPKPKSVSIGNEEVSFIVSVGVGSPPTDYFLIVDTGSSNTWVGAAQAYVPTVTSVNTSQPVNVSYSDGSFFNGSEFFDIITFKPNLVVNQSLGVAQFTSQDFQGLDGILGLGPTDLTNRTLGGANELIPTVVDSLHTQGVIQERVIGVFLKPTIGNDVPTQSGRLDLGGIDYSKTTGPVSFVPVTSRPPASRFWGVDASMSLFGFPKAILANGSGIVDTGTTNLLLATDAFNAYQEAVGATFDNATRLLKITKKNFLRIPSLLINMGETVIELTPDAQAWPMALNTALGGDPDNIYLPVQDNGKTNGDSGFDFTIGQTVLQRWYSVYDSDKSRVGFAPTKHTFSVTNVLNDTLP